MIKDGFSSDVLGLFRDLFVGLDELYLHVQLARDFLDLGHEEKIVDESKYPCWSVHALGEWLHIGTWPERHCGSALPA